MPETHSQVTSMECETEGDNFAGPHPAGGLPWDDAIKALDRGHFSLQPFLQALEDAGHNGPVILHTFEITGDVDHLQRSIQAYDRYRDNLN